MGKEPSDTAALAAEAAFFKDFDEPVDYKAMLRAAYAIDFAALQQENERLVHVLDEVKTSERALRAELQQATQQLHDMQVNRAVFMAVQAELKERDAELQQAREEKSALEKDIAALDFNLRGRITQLEQQLAQSRDNEEDETKWREYWRSESVRLRDERDEAVGLLEQLRPEWRAPNVAAFLAAQRKDATK